jgi:effector-binding domain-containing protein
MTNPPIEVVTLSAQPTLMIRTEVPRAELGLKLAQLLPRTFQHAMASGAQPCGMPFVRYLGDEPGPSITIEAGIPVARTVAGAADIAAGQLPGGRVARLSYQGPYEGLPEARAALRRWAQEKGEAHLGSIWEVYVTDPSTEPDPRRWQTHVLLPLDA